jgi:hypothetical protein
MLGYTKSPGEQVVIISGKKFLVNCEISHKNIEKLLIKVNDYDAPVMSGIIKRI